MLYGNWMIFEKLGRYVDAVEIYMDAIKNLKKERTVKEKQL